MPHPLSIDEDDAVLHAHHHDEIPQPREISYRRGMFFIILLEITQIASNVNFCKFWQTYIALLVLTGLVAAIIERGFKKPWSVWFWAIALGFLFSLIQGGLQDPILCGHARMATNMTTETT